MAAVTTPQPVARAGWLSLKNRRYLMALLFVLPALINFAIFRYIPILMAMHASVFEYSLLGGFGGFVGLNHYLRAFTDDLFWQSLRVSILYVLMKVPLQVVMSLLLALFLARELRGMGIIRTILFIPVVTSIVVVAMLWGMMLNKDLGLLQSVLEAFGSPHIGFLSSELLALPTMAVMMVWKEVGFSTIIFVAGLKSIPGVFYDAASIDGASPMRQMWHITLPLLKPVTLFVIVTQSISSMQIFVPIFVMTDGGPFFSTNAIVFYIYQNGFRYSDMGYASAMSFLVLVLLVSISIAQFRLLRSDTEY
ncbi:MAG: sugar ABC transporter permease [Chloroflexi bacterium]|nr:sugar ABC transporter permease [Chloroflexota bacterium]